MTDKLLVIIATGDKAKALTVLKKTGEPLEPISLGEMVRDEK